LGGGCDGCDGAACRPWPLLELAGIVVIAYRNYCDSTHSKLWLHVNYMLILC
jgi:hypothetical protein